MRIGKTEILLSTFFKRGLKKDKSPNDWGAIIITGFQGTGKTYIAVLKAYQNYRTKIITNIESLKIPNKEIKYFRRLEEIYNDIEPNVIYIIDELGNRFGKNSKQDLLFYRFLQQCRKRNRLCLLIHQEFKDVPTWLRHPCRFSFNTTKVRFLNLFCSSQGDIKNAYLNENMEWCCDTLFKTVYKRNDFIASMYDTNECINEL